MAAHSDRDLKHTIKFRDLHTADRGERVGMLNDDAVAPHGHSPDYVILSGEWEIGRIYEVRGAPPNLECLVARLTWPPEALGQGCKLGGS
jgi:hypothetical protein